MPDYERPRWPLMGAYCRQHLEKIMIKTMQARYAGFDSRTGASIRPGDEIQYDTATRRAWLAEPGDMADLGDDQQAASRYNPTWVSHVWNSGGKEYYRNKQGRCEDAPCCGCCTA